MPDRSDTRRPKPWTTEEHLRALRASLERLRDDQEPLPRSAAFVMLDHLGAIEAAWSRKEQP